MKLSVKNKEQLEKVMGLLGIPNCDEELCDDVFPIEQIQVSPFLIFSFDEMANVVDYLRDCEKGGQE